MSWISWLDIQGVSNNVLLFADNIVSIEKSRHKLMINKKCEKNSRTKALELVKYHREGEANNNFADNIVSIEHNFARSTKY